MAESKKTYLLENSLLIIPNISAFLGLFYSLYHYYPNIIASLGVIAPIYAVIAFVSAALMDSGNGTSAGGTFWVVSFGVSFGGISLLSFLVMVLIFIYTGAGVWFH